MKESEEIEVEVLEVVDHEPTHHSTKPTKPTNRQEKPAREQARHPFSGGFAPRSFRIPAYLWPLAFILGLILFLVAIAVGLILVIPFLIIRAIVRLLVGPSR